MSWFQSTSTGLNSAFDSLSETVQKATESVHDAIPTEHKAFLAKLTLNTEEMISERQNFRDEAARKELAKTCLDKLLPWETLDLEREILVEECKDAILELSSREDSFFGPYEMPLLNVQLEEKNIEEEGSEDQLEVERTEGDEEHALVDDARANNTAVEEGQSIDVDEESKSHHHHMMPSEESREKLAKLEPLPTLLDEFSLDAHVGLIQKLLKVDPGLVNMQANLSGGGEREKVFWRNYFFHCAFTRYEAGLSIDEIWSYQKESIIINQPETTSIECIGDVNGSLTAVTGNNEEEAIVFDSSGDQNIGFQSVEEVAEADTISDRNGAGTDTSLTALSEGSTNNGFELVDDAVDESIGDPALDELEAEIARELED